MISGGQSAAEITYFLHKWNLDAKKVLGGELNIEEIEIDFSWALIHSVCNAFLKLRLAWCFFLFIVRHQTCMASPHKMA